MERFSDTSAQLQFKLLSPLIDKLIAAGAECYLVGGAVRDLYLKQTPRDFDFVVCNMTNEKLYEQLKSFNVEQHKFIECSYRIYDILNEPIDISIPRNIVGNIKTFDPSYTIEMHLKDCDFTMNAMAINMKTLEWIDLYDGKKHMDAHKIVIVPNHETIAYDPIIPLRAARFRAQFGFEIDQKSFDIIKHSLSLLFSISTDRRVIELYKMLQCQDFKLGIDLLIKLNIFSKLYVEYDALYPELITTINKIS